MKIYISCLDVNECDALNGGCAHKCKNKNGSFICQCNRGYFLSGNGKSCLGKYTVIGACIKVGHENWMFSLYLILYHI